MRITLSVLCFAIVLMASLAWAEHPGVATSHRDAIQKAMLVHIKDVTDHNGNGMFPVFDPESKTVGDRLVAGLTGFRGITKLRDRLFYRAWGLSLRHWLTYRLGGWLQTRWFRWRAWEQSTLPTTDKDPYTNRGWLSDAPGPVAGWTSVRDMPTPPGKSFRHWWRSERS